MSGKSGQGTRRVMMSSSVLRPSEASKTDDEQDGADAAASVDQVVIASLQKQLEQATISLKRAEAENERLSASVAMRENVRIHIPSLPDVFVCLFVCLFVLYPTYMMSFVLRTRRSS